MIQGKDLRPPNFQLNQLINTINLINQTDLFN